MNFHDFCGDIIYDEAGEVRFDAQKIPLYLQKNKCSVTVKPKSEALKGTTQALFYFTKFELTGPCESMNVSVLDGSFFGGTHMEGNACNILYRLNTLLILNLLKLIKSREF